MSIYKRSWRGQDKQIVRKSVTLNNVADETYNLIEIPKFSFVKEVWAVIETAYSSGGEVTIGFSGNGETVDTDGFMLNFDVDPYLVGVKSSKGTQAVWADGKWFNSNRGTITLTQSGSATTKGKITVFVEYCVIV